LIALRESIRNPVPFRAFAFSKEMVMNEIVPFDPARMLWGSAPALFYLEIAVRVTVIWLWTVVMLRWVGGRSVSQMSVVEFLLVIALGSAVGDPMFQPDVPLFHAMLVILLVVLADKAVDYALQNWTKAKRIVDGTPTEILRDGRLSMAGLKEERLGSPEVMELLRLKGVRNLGQVEFAFIEPSGEVSVFQYAKPRPGLPIVPPLELHRSSDSSEIFDPCCISCGLIRKRDTAVCPNCKEFVAVAARTESAGPSVV
jgi:uncharacterized membrane protein YcaP (DUF421 family)